MTARSTGKSAILAIVGLVFVLGAPELSIGSRIAPGSDLASLAVHEVVWWILIALVIAYIVLVERQGLNSIGLRRPSWKSLAIAVPVGALMVAIMMVSYAVIFPALHLQVNVQAQARIIHTPLLYRLALVIRAAVCEEIIYRGYTIERVQALSGSRMAALAASVAAFTAAHWASWGAAQLIPVASAGLLLGLVYLWRRDLWCTIIAHFLADGSGFLFA